MERYQLPARQLGLAVLLLAAMLGCSSVSRTASVDAPVSGFPKEPPGEPVPTAGRSTGDGDAEEIFELVRRLGTAAVSDAGYLLTAPLRLDGKGALLLGGTAAAIGGLIVVDEDIQKAFQENRTETNNDIADSLETIGFGRNFLLGHAGVLAAGYWFREHKEGDKVLRTALVSLEAQLFVEVMAGLTKLAVGRARPSEGKGSTSFDPFDGFNKSFPSSHAARAFAVAAVVSDRYDQPIPFLLYSAATLISLSRIHLNDHFASDVFAGAVLGLAVGKALSWRHPDFDRGVTVLPFLPDGGDGLGVALRYRF